MAVLDRRAVADAVADSRVEVAMKTAAAMERVAATSKDRTAAEMSALLRQEMRREGITPAAATLP